MAEDTEHLEAQASESQEQQPQSPQPQSEEEQLTESIFRDEDGDSLDIQHLRDLVAALKVDGTWFRRQIWVFLLIFLSLVAYVTNSYQAQQEVLQEDELTKRVEDCKYRCLTRESELTRRTRQSQLERALRDRGDSTLIIGSNPPFLLDGE